MSEKKEWSQKCGGEHLARVWWPKGGREIRKEKTQPSMLSKIYELKLNNHPKYKDQNDILTNVLIIFFGSIDHTKCFSNFMLHI